VRGAVQVKGFYYLPAASSNCPISELYPVQLESDAMPVIPAHERNSDLVSIYAVAKEVQGIPYLSANGAHARVSMARHAVMRQVWNACPSMNLYCVAFSPWGKKSARETPRKTC